MTNSTYVTFGKFNNKEASPPPTPRYVDQPYSMSDNGNDPYAYHHQEPKMPIRQHMTQPRNPYNPQMLPPYPRTDLPSSVYPPPMSPPPSTSQYTMPSHMSSHMSSHMPSNMSSNMPLNVGFHDVSAHSTPIDKAFSDTSSNEGFEMSSSSPSSSTPQRTPRLMDATCVDINDHIVNCPICSKYYQNHGTVYVGIIILLAFIILIFLLKSIMEIRR